MVIDFLVEIEMSQAEHLFCPCREYHEVSIVLTGHSGRVEINVVLRVVEGNPRFPFVDACSCNGLVSCRRVSWRNYLPIDYDFLGTGDSNDSGFVFPVKHGW